MDPQEMLLKVLKNCQFNTFLPFFVCQLNYTLVCLDLNYIIHQLTLMKD